METTLKAATHCEGCDQEQPDVRTYVCIFTGNPVAERVDYCGDCASLARADWNGETEATIGPIDPEKHCASCTVALAGDTAEPVALANCSSLTHGVRP